MADSAKEMSSDVFSSLTPLPRSVANVVGLVLVVLAMSKGFFLEGEATTSKEGMVWYFFCPVGRKFVKK